MRLLLPLLLISPFAHAADIDALLPYKAREGAPARARLLPLLQAEAQAQNVPPALADAVAMIETGYTEDAVGSSGEIGLMQIMPGTAAMLGFNGTQADLFKPETNIHYGVAYLARAWAASGGNVCRALMKYRAGTGEEAYSPLSVQYCQRAQSWLSAQNSPLAALLAATTPAGSMGAGPAADPHVIHLASWHGHANLAAIGEIAGIPGFVVDGAPTAARTGAAGQGAARRADAAIAEALRDGDADPHVIHIGTPDP